MYVTEEDEGWMYWTYVDGELMRYRIDEVGLTITRRSYWRTGEIEKIYEEKQNLA